MRKLKNLVLFLFWILLLSNSGILHAQKIETFQTKTVYHYSDTITNTINSITTQSIFQLPDKGFICFGLSSFPDNVKSKQCWPVVFRLDSLGRTLWAKRYLKILGISNAALVNSTASITPMIRVTDTTFAFAACTAFSYNKQVGSNGNYITEIDINGNVLWNRWYSATVSGGGYNPLPMALTKTPDGGFIIGGYVNNISFGSSAGFYISLIKTNDSGYFEWGHLYGTLLSDSAQLPFTSITTKVLNAPGGGYLISGVQKSDLSNWTDNLIFKVDSTGGLLWRKNYGRYCNTTIGASDMLETPGAIYIASPYLYNPSSSNSSILSLIKLDTFGNLIWAKGYQKLTGRRVVILYDSIKKDILLSSDYDSVKTSYFARADTSGIIRSLRLYNNAFDFHGGLGFNTSLPINADTIFPAENICQIRNGFAMLFISNDINEGYYVIKTDTEGITNKCDSRTINPVPVSVSYGSVKMDSTVFNLMGSTYSYTAPIYPIVTEDTLFCDPFISWFGWKNPCSGLMTQFYDSSYFRAVNWKWDFGDSASGNNDSSKVKNPTHIYSKSGTYKVQLIAGNGTNKDTITRAVHILQSPLAFYKDTTVCLGDSVALTGAPGISYSWNHTAMLSDSTTQSVWVYPYQDTTVNVEVTNVVGCYAMDTFNVKFGSHCSGTSKISGIINKYAAAIALDSCLNAISVDTSSVFKIGDKILVIEMKGASIDTSNTSSFGNIKNIGSAGKYEYNTVDSIAGKTVYFRYKLQNQYDISGLVQLVLIPQYNDVIVSDTLKAGPWNGNKGGVLVFDAKTVILGAAINGSGQGFWGGSLDTGSIICKKNDYFYGSASSFGAHKGEGIANIMSTYFEGKGCNANGGGGGDSYEAGGGGGGNDSTGGIGGNEFEVCGAIANGGIGGNGLHSYSTQNRLFLGGGGGAGFQNYFSGTPGANGGGIVIISALKLAGDGYNIISNGSNQNAVAGTDAAGGGGAGGSVLLDINDLATNCVVSINGGKGGNTGYNKCTGPGGGGSGGVLLLASSSLSGRINLSATGGSPGININSSATCYGKSYGADTGKKGGVVTGVSVPQGITTFKRPYTTINYATVIDSGHVQVSFTKSILTNVIGYQIYRSINNGAFVDIGTLKHPASSPVTYTDTVNTANDSFSYHISTLDTCGDISNYSATHTTIHLKDTVKGCEQAIYLTWNPYAGWPVKKYEIYRSVNGGAENLLATLSGNIENFKDSTEDYHNQYCYRVLAIDTSQKDSSWSEKTCGQTYFLDTAKIITATKTVTSATNGTVIIKWKSIAGQRYMSGTELYYSADGKHYGLLALIPTAQDSFVQTGVNTQTADGYYYIKNIDSCLTLSDSSLIHKTMTLTVNVGQLIHKLNWTPYYGFKIKTYKIQRLGPNGFVTIDSVPGTDTSSREFPAPCNYAIYYRIEAVGYNPGTVSEPVELSWSDTVGKQALDTLPPNAAKITSLSVLNSNNIQLNFTSSDSPDVYKYVIERGFNGLWIPKDYINHNHGSASSITDTVTGISNQLCYTIITLDSCLNAAESDTICVETLSGNALSCKAEVTLSFPKIITPPTAPDSFAVYRSIDRINYNIIKELPASTSIFIDSTVTANIHYDYKLEAIYYQAGMGSYSDSFGIVPRIIPDADTAQIVYATVIKSDETTGAIYIKWKRAALNDTNARGYYLYSFNSTNGKYALLKNISDLNDTSFINSNINTIKDIYKYYVITYNVCDVGINSNIHRTVLLNVQGKNLSEQLDWINYLGIPVKNYSIYKSIDGGTQSLVKNVGTDSSYLDSNIACNHNITYQIQAILSNSEISFSDSITVKSYDSIRPETRPIIVATVSKTGITDGRILLSWNSATDNNLLGYNVYRSENGFNWQLIKGGYPLTYITDSGLDTYDASYYYKVQPIDSCGNTGTFTNYHETIHLKASSGNSYNQISWSSYVGWPVRKYLLYRDGILIDSFANNQFVYKDSSIICKTVYQYLIKAIDSVNDTIISASNTDSAKAANHIPPQKVYIKTVTVSKPNKAASISWSPSTSYDVKDYMVYRKLFETGNLKFLDSTSKTTYIDSSEYFTEPDCYYVFSRDHCGNISDGSNEGCIIILDAKNQQGNNQLTWNSYQNWPDGVQSYNVYKNEDSTGWQLIGTTSPLTPLPGRGEFEDKKLGDSTIDFCYQVEAIENAGQYNQLSRSTVECVHQDATVFIPNSFTPYNQDGVNDLFGPKGLYIKSYDMKIYNRWGEMVYASPQPSPNGEGAGWDGTYKGQYVQQGIYIYLITVTDYNGKRSYFKGTITMFE